MLSISLCAVTIVIWMCTAVPVTSQGSKFGFFNTYGDHMVLQQAPHRPIVWGYVPCTDSVTVQLDGKDQWGVTIHGGPQCRWSLQLQPTKADTNTTHTITAISSNHGSVNITDVVFGDVWVCSGQSNMQFTVSQVYNATEEISKAVNYSLIRLFTAGRSNGSSDPLEDIQDVEQPWSIASPESLNGGAWKHFSATCWFFGRNLFDSLKYPIGLIDVDRGGTRIEAWSSPDALAKCGNKTLEAHTGTASGDVPNGPNSPSAMWNAMISPFVQMPIKGVIWYQGEANSGSKNYNCTFPALIDDWRDKWYQFPKNYHNTDLLFGFGFVQLATNGSSNKTLGGFPVVRWAQTAEYGFVPNKRQLNVFMAVAMDLGDPTSPFKSIHPRNKQDVGKRLARGALAVVYKNSTVHWSGPLPITAEISNPKGPTEVTVDYKLLSEDKLELRYNYGFELGCGNGISGPSQWIEGTITSAVKRGRVKVEFADCPSPLNPMSIRYCWRTNPCPYKKCPIYAGDLPSPPFAMSLGKHMTVN